MQNSLENRDDGLAAEQSLPVGRKWCAKHRDGWCALKNNRPVKEAAFQVMTKCKFFICLPWGISFREPTCPDCIKSIGA